MVVLPNFKCNNTQSQICMEAKFVKYPYKSTEKNFNPLDMIHTNIYDMKLIPTRAGKKYLITLLMIILDIVMFICYQVSMTEVENQLD